MNAITKEGCYSVGYMVPDGYRRKKERTITEYTSACYKDIGCRLHPHCLECPEELPVRCPLERKERKPHKTGNEP